MIHAVCDRSRHGFVAAGTLRWGGPLPKKSFPLLAHEGPVLSKSILNPNASYDLTRDGCTLGKLITWLGIVREFSFDPKTYAR